MSAGEGPFKRLWLWPLVIACATTYGLVCALVADDIWDLVGAICLGIPALISIWLLAKASRKRADREPASSGLDRQRP